MKEGFDMRAILLIGLGALAASCSYAPPVGPSPMAQDKLARELAGLVPQPAQACLPNYRTQDMVVIDENTVLFRDGRNVVYRNELNGGCSNLGGQYALVTKTIGSSLCRGDIAQVTDLHNHMVVGSCSLGDFIPYRRP
jgi:hypothetical protein